VGTSLFDQETGELVHDFSMPDEQVVIAKGGRGGRGNQHFATRPYDRQYVHHALGGPHAVDAAGSFRRMAKRAGPAVFLRQNTSLLARPDRRADLARIICPTLLAWGKEDRFAAVEHGREMAARILGARLVVLDGCGHLPTLEQPEATVTMVREWLSLIG